MPERWESVFSGLGWPPFIAAAAGLAVASGPDSTWLAVGGWLGTLGLCEALFRCRSRRLSVVTGLTFGATANAAGLFSLGPLLAAYAHLSMPLAWGIAALIWLAQGVPYALAADLVHAIARRGWPRWMAVTGSLTVALALCPQIFPWHLGATQVGLLPFAQIAELGGESLLGLCFFAAVAAAHGSVRARGKARVATIAIAASALTLPLIYGLVRLPAVDQQRALAAKLMLGVVQANAPIPDGDREAYARRSLATLRAMTRPLEERGVALTIWGESAYPYPLLRTTTHAPNDAVRAPLSDGVRGPILLGLETYSSFADNSARYNSAWLVRRDNRLGSRVDKVHLIPFAEYVPFWQLFAPLQEVFGSPGFNAGAGGTVRTQSGKLGVLICYEDLFASAARESVRDGARALIDISNDVWFGRSREPFFHDAFARLRAIEQRRDLLRAVNGGPSSLITASGEQRLLSAPFTRASFTAEVALLDARTPYSLLGDLTAPACALLTLLALARTRPLKRSTF